MEDLWLLLIIPVSMIVIMLLPEIIEAVLVALLYCLILIAIVVLVPTAMIYSIYKTIEHNW